MPEELQKAELDARAAKDALDAAQSIYDNRQRLFREGAIAQKDVNDAQRRAEPGAHHLRDGAQAPRRSAGRSPTTSSSKRRPRSATPRRADANPRRRSSATRASRARSTASSPTCRSIRAKCRPPAQPVVTVMDVSQVIARTHVSQAEARGAESRQRRESDRPGRRADRGQGHADQSGARCGEHHRRSVGAGRQPGRQRCGRARACKVEMIAQDRAERARHSRQGGADQPAGSDLRDRHRQGQQAAPAQDRGRHPRRRQGADHRRPGERPARRDDRRVRAVQARARRPRRRRKSRSRRPKEEEEPEES